jgi:hypothetical protein
LFKYLFGIEDAKAEVKPEEEGLGWFKTIQKNVKSISVNRIAQRIDAIAKTYSKDFDMKIRPHRGKVWAIDYSTDPPTIRYPEQDLKDKSAECIVGSAIHEGGHRDISWGIPKSFLEKEAYRLLLNGIEDPRVNNWEVERLPGSNKYIQAAWEEGFPKNPPEAFRDDRVYPNVQYVLGVIHHWFRHEDHPSIKNPRVLEALHKTRKSVQEIYSTHAGKVTISRKDEEMVEISSIAYGSGLYRLPRVAGKVFLRRNDIGSIERTDETHVEISTAKGKEVIELPAVGDKVTRLVSIWPSADEKKKAFLEVVRRIKSEVMPEYDKLVQESIDIAKQSAGKSSSKSSSKSGSGSSSSSGSSGSQDADSKAKDDVENQSKDFADSFGSQIIPDKDKKKDDQEESDGQGQGQSGKNEPKDKSRKGGGGSAQKDDVCEKEKEDGKLSGQEGADDKDKDKDKDKEKDGQGAVSGKDKDKSDKDKEKDGQGAASGKDKADKDKADKDKTGSGKDKSADKDKGGKDKTAGKDKKAGAEDSGEKSDSDGAENNLAEDGKPGGMSGKGGRGVFDLQERLRIEREIARTVQSKTTDYDKYYAKVATLIEKLFGVLNNELQKDVKFRYKGDYPDGSKINLKKAMTMKATGDMNIWQRRVKPTKRSFKITIVLDESGSMNSAGKTESAILSMVVLQEVLLRLNIDFAIEGFSNAPSLHKRFDQKFGHQDKGKLLASIEEFIRRGGGTNDDLAVASAVKGLEAESSDSKVIIVITDGQSGNPESLKAKIKEANRKGVAVVGIGIGSGMTEVKDVYRPGIVVERVEDLPMVLGKVLIDIILWGKINAVPYYGPRADKDVTTGTDNKAIGHTGLIKYGLGHLLAAGIGIAGTLALTIVHPALASALGIASGIGLYHFAMHGITALYIIDRKKASADGNRDYKIAQTIRLADGGMYIWEEPEFYTLPYLVRRYILLHESAHLRGFGDPAAYIFPWLGLFRTTPLAVSKKGSSGFAIGVPRDADDDMIKAVRESAGDDAYIIRAADETELGGLIRKTGLVGIFVDKTISAGYIRRHKLIKEAYMVKLARDYGLILSVNEISGKTRREMIEAVKAVLPDVEKLSFADIVRRLKDAQSVAGFSAEGREGLRQLVSKRSSQLRRSHNSGADKAIDKAASSGRAIVAVTTEGVAVNDDQFMHDLKTASDKGIINYLGYGGIFKDEDEARRSVVACGYTGSMENIRFVRTAGRSFGDIAGDIIKDVPGAGMESIGIRAIAGEIKKSAQESGVLLEIPQMTVNGRSICPVIHTYRILLEIMTALGPGSVAAEGLIIPGVHYDSVKKAFMYMPKSVPIDYDKDVEAYRSAVMLLSSAA